MVKKKKFNYVLKLIVKLIIKIRLQKSPGKKTGHVSRKCYLVTDSPGTISQKPTSGLNGKFNDFDFTKEESEQGYENFCVIKCKIQSIEWLYLAAKGHRRALLKLGKTNEFKWLIP